MSERWGFDLSMEAVRLMRRDAEQWHEFAVEKLEGEDIETRLASLVANAKTADPVDIFLPRDQILFTTVEVDSDTDPNISIRSAMEGRTPYNLDELEIDWELSSPESAQVAAVARETLDEAEAFVTKGGLTVRAFSSLDVPHEFPRFPVFAEKHPNPTVTQVAPEAEPAFSTARAASALAVDDTPDKSDPIEDVATEDPVVKVDDPTPVLQLPKSTLPPLNPGAPLPRPTSEPRVHTDIGAIVAQRRAASLTPSSGVTIHRRDRAVPTPALAAIAAALSIGIAIIIWTIIPTSHQQTSGLAEETVTSPEPQVEEIVGVEPEPAPRPEFGPYTTEISVAATQPKTPELASARQDLNWGALSEATATPPLQALSTDFSVNAGPQPTIVWLAGRPGALKDLEGYVPDTLAFLEAVAIPETPTVLASLTTQADALLQRGELFGLPANEPAAMPELATSPPEPLPQEEVQVELIAEAPATEDPVVENEVAALDPEILEPTPTLPTITEPVSPLTEDPAPTPELTTPVAEEPTVTEPLVQEVETALEPEIVLPNPTELASSVPDTAPPARPTAFETDIERQKFGGRTLTELSEIRPGERPASAQMEALIALADAPPSELAVQTSIVPRGKPGDFDAIVAASLLQQRQEREARAVAAATPDTSDAIEAALAEDAIAEPRTRPEDSPRVALPSNASVARQATIEDAIRLNRISLVGVFGRPSDRRALIRLPSGQYIKVEVGDRVDGGTVAAISDTALQYQKGGRTVALTLPQG